MKRLSTHSKSVQLLKTVSTAVLLMLIGRAIGTAQQKVTKASQPTLQSESSNTNSSRNRQIIVNTDLVTLAVSVMDHDGRYVPGLVKKDFTITDNKLPQEITFFSDADSPVSVGIVFDVSGSMSGKKIEQAKEALSAFIQTSHPQDEYFLIGFSSQPQLLLDSSRHGDAVIREVSVIEPHGSTTLYDATSSNRSCWSYDINIRLVIARRIFALDGKWHRVKFKVVTPPEFNRVFIRRRERYFAVGPSR